MLKVKVDWDLEMDGEETPTLEEAGVKEIMEIPDDVVADAIDNANGDNEEHLYKIADWLSDEFGWCIYGLKIIE